MNIIHVFFLFLLCSTLQGSDTANSFSVYGREVEIITSKPNEAASSQAKTGSNKVKIMLKEDMPLTTVLNLEYNLVINIWDLILAFSMH